MLTWKGCKLYANVKRIFGNIFYVFRQNLRSLSSPKAEKYKYYYYCLGSLKVLLLLLILLLLGVYYYYNSGSLGVPGWGPRENTRSLSCPKAEKYHYYYYSGSSVVPGVGPRENTRSLWSPKAEKYNYYYYYCYYYYFWYFYYNYYYLRSLGDSRERSSQKPQVSIKS